MGYNGSNRRHRGSMFHKSSMNFGSKLLAEIITLPISIAADAIKHPTTSVEQTHQHQIEQVIQTTIEVDTSLVESATSSNYMYLKEQYQAIILNNKQIAKQIDIYTKLIKKLKIKKILYWLLLKSTDAIKQQIQSTFNHIQELRHEVKVECIEASLLNDGINENELISIGNQLLTNSPIFFIFPKEHKIHLTESFNNYPFSFDRVSLNSTTSYKLPLDTCNLLLFNSGVLKLLFFGKGMIIESNDKYSIIDYSEIECLYKEIRMVENENFDCTNFITNNHTWLHTTTKGLPDMRYRYNPRLPIVIYGNMTIHLKNDFDIEFLFGNTKLGSQFAQIIRNKR